MGRIRLKSVKRIADKLIASHKTHFSTEFDENKQQVQELTNVSTKKLRNVISGYVTKKIKTGED